MKFYKENEINPAASCLPMLVQLPVFFALYFVLRNFAKHMEALPRELDWLIVPDITAKITAHWSGYVLLVVYVASQVGYRVLRPAAGDAEVAALPVHDPAGRVRPGDHPLPGRPAHVLDDDQPLDDRPGHRHPAADAQARTSTEAFVSDRAEGGAAAATERAGGGAEAEAGAGGRRPPRRVSARSEGRAMTVTEPLSVEATGETVGEAKWAGAARARAARAGLDKAAVQLPGRSPRASAACSASAMRLPAWSRRWTPPRRGTAAGCAGRRRERPRLRPPRAARADHPCARGPVPRRRDRGRGRGHRLDCSATTSAS